MKLNKKAVFVLLLLLLLSSFRQQAQSPSMTDRQWQELTRNKDFAYKKEKELVQMKNEVPANNVFSKFIAALIGFFSSPAGRAVIWSCFFLVIAYALFRIFLKEGFFPKRKKDPAEEPGEAMEPVMPEDLLNTDWDRQLQHALAEKNFRLAVRSSYMRLLQLLQERHLIQYRPDKTNYDYYYELANPAVKKPFSRLSRQYEYAWYGNYDIAPHSFEEYMNTFNELRSNLQRS